MSLKLAWLATPLLLACVTVTEAQQPSKLPRIGLLTTGTPQALAHPLEGFKEGLREQGYEDGRNIRVDVRYAE